MRSMEDLCTIDVPSIVCCIRRDRGAAVLERNHYAFIYKVGSTAGLVLVVHPTTVLAQPTPPLLSPTWEVGTVTLESDKSPTPGAKTSVHKRWDEILNTHKEVTNFSLGV